MKNKKTATKRANLSALLILCVGSTAMLGEILSTPAIKAMGLATGAAPFTKVFCAAETRDGKQTFETFAAEFYLHYKLEDGTRKSLKITPEIYQNLHGPYQRRNVYGAVLAYGPAMPAKMQSSSLYYALKSPGNVPRELGLPESARDLSVEMISRTRSSSSRWHFKPNKNQDLGL